MRWDATGAAVILEPPPGFQVGIATSVTDDGHVVAGYAQAPGASTGDTPPDEVAVVWDDRRSEPVLMVDFLIEQGVPATAALTAVRLRNARVSRDGRTFIGDATDMREAGKVSLSWLAHLPQGY